MWVCVVVAALGVESYEAYVARAFLDRPVPELAAALDRLGVKALQLDDVLPLTVANSAFLDSICKADEQPSQRIVPPSSDARIAVPLLVQLVREWSAHGHAQRAQAFSPIVEVLRDHLAGMPRPRVVVPGSGLGRLVHDIAEALALARPELVAVEADVHAQHVARHILEPADSAGSGGTACNSGDAAVRRATERSSCLGGAHAVIYPALHIATGWANVSDRLVGLRLPDISMARRRQVQEQAIVQLVIGRFPDALAPEALPPPMASGDDTSFDAAATSFFMDVAADPLHVVASIHALLVARHGLWVNVGPAAYPDAPNEALGGPNLAPALSMTQLLSLVRDGGRFDVLEERAIPCEYGGLPYRLERTERQCLFFVARARPPTLEDSLS